MNNLTLAVIGKKHFGNPIPKEWYSAAGELMETLGDKPVIKRWVCADHHFGHRNILNMDRADGAGPLRPFLDIEYHNDYIVNAHNKLVGTNDRVYFLGDVAIARSGLVNIARMNGKKILIKGNHDIFNLKKYVDYFEDIVACRVFTINATRLILSHIPVHPDQFKRFDLNIHGHLHDEVVKLFSGKPDPRYKCVSLEQNDFKPILLETLLPNDTI